MHPMTAPRLGALAFALVLYYLMQIPSAWLGLQNPWGAPPSWHESGQWLYMTIHHIAQALLALLVIGLLSGGKLRNWGLNLQNRRRSLELFGAFAVWFGVIMAASLALQLLAGTPSLYHRPLAADHIAGGLFFMWIVSGTSEEVLFRGLFQTWLSRFWSGEIRLLGVVAPSAGVIAAALFALVHINFSVTTWQITHFSPVQVLLSFVLGLFYAIAYHRTGSLLAPVLAHNLANGLMETTNLLVAGGG